MWFKRGNDGLTDRQRHKFAQRWRGGQGSLPTAEQMERLVAMTKHQSRTLVSGFETPLAGNSRSEVQSESVTCEDS